MPGRAKLRRFETTDRSNVPTSRNGKHKAIISEILNNLSALDKGKSLKIPLDQLPDTKVNIRSALNRATHKTGKPVSTAADEQYLYIWNS
jgi:hypothetical protein